MHRKNKQGRFIVIDGIGGCGKTTHAELILKHLGTKAILTHEPGGAPRAEKIRKILLKGYEGGSPLSDFFLFWAARAEHMREKIVPALLSGRHVISDRFDSATFGFQMYGEKHPHLAKAFWAIREAVLGKHVPDAYIILDIPVEAAERRRAARTPRKDRFDEKDRAFQKRTRAGFKAFAKAIGSRAHIVNANRTPEEVDKGIWAIVRKVLRR